MQGGCSEKCSAVRVAFSDCTCFYLFANTMSVSHWLSFRKIQQKARKFDLRIVYVYFL